MGANAPGEPGSTRSDRIAEAIRAEITSGRRAPGSRLNEQAIADDYSVSRTPVREAVRQLAAAGLVDILPRRGAFVAQIPASRLIQMFEAMSELEGNCARLAAQRMSAEEKIDLERAHLAYKRYTEGAEVDQYYDASLEFHRLIFKGCHNEVLEDMANRLFNRLTGYRRSQVNSAQRAKTSFREHQAVLDAILAGDGGTAERAMRDHTGVVGSNALDLVRALRLAQA